jgi:phage protein D
MPFLSSLQGCQVSNPADSHAPLIIEILFETRGGQLIEIPSHDFLQSFEVRFSDRSSPFGRLTLFDFEGDYLESLFLTEGLSRRVLLRWGWDDGRSISQHPQFTMQITKYSPTFTPEGVELQLDLGAVSAVKQVSDKKDRSWTSGKTATEIFREIAAAREWKLVDQFGQSTVEESDGFLPEVSQSGESDMNFIRKILLPKAVNVGKRSFTFFTDRDGTVHFHSDTFLNRVAIVYNFARAAMGSVISFAPTDESLFNALQGSGNAVYVAVDSAEGTKTEIATTDAGGVPDAKKTIHPDSAHITDHPGARKARIAVTAVTPEELLNKAAHRVDWLRKQAFSADLAVKGTHAPQAQDYVTVNYYKHDGRIHYLSGTFLVKTVIHTLDSGGWQTAMELQRTGKRAMEEKTTRQDADQHLKAKKDSNTVDTEDEAAQAARGFAAPPQTVTKPVH